MDARLSNVLLAPGDHASQPSGATVATPSLYPCSDHGWERWNGATWELVGAGLGGIDLDSLTDVDTTSTPPADGDRLVWNDGAGLWVPASVSAVGADEVAYDPTASGLTATDVQAAIDELDTTIDGLGGGGGGFTMDAILPRYLQTPNLHATYSDDFTGALDTGKWTRRTVTSGDETTDVWNGLGGMFWTNANAGWHYMMPCPSGDFLWHAAVAVESSSATSQLGACIIDSSGNGRGAVLRQGTGIANVSLTSYVYSGYNTDYAETGVRAAPSRLEIWAVSIQKVGTAYSVAGRRCLPDVAGFDRLPVFAASNVWAGTPDRLTVGIPFTDAAFSRAAILRANLTT